MGTAHPREAENQTPSLDCRVLLVSAAPDPDNALARALRAGGAEVEIECSGVDARDRALAAWEAERPFDLIVVDLRHEPSDTCEAMGRLRGAGYEQPILAIGAEASAPECARRRRAGFDALLGEAGSQDEVIRACAPWAPGAAADAA